MLMQLLLISSLFGHYVHTHNACQIQLFEFIYYYMSEDSGLNWVIQIAHDSIEISLSRAAYICGCIED